MQIKTLTSIVQRERSQYQKVTDCMLWVIKYCPNDYLTEVENKSVVLGLVKRVCECDYKGWDEGVFVVVEQVWLLVVTQI